MIDNGETDLLTAFRQGKAAVTSDTFTECPYDHESNQGQSWQSGWDEGHNIGFPLTEAQKKKKRLGLPFAEWRETFGPKMLGYRHKFRMNQTDFAFVVGTTQGQVSRYERGVMPVPMELQIIIERAVELWDMWDMSAAAEEQGT
jgi:ribosome modulation factor